jgi:hypothetical protein
MEPAGGRRHTYMASGAGAASEPKEGPAVTAAQSVMPEMPSDLRFGARGRIRILDLPFTSRMLRVGLDGSRRIWPAHVGMPRRSGRIQTGPIGSSGGSNR